MKKQNLLTLLSIVTMTISLLVTPASAHASTLASDQSASMANDILLAGGQEEVAVTLLTADTCTGEITGSGQPGAFVKVHHNGRVYATRVCPDGYWSVIANPAVNYGEKVTAIQKDKNGTTSAFTASASRCSVNSNIAQFNFITCEYKYCPYCCEALPLDADVCPNCKADLNGNANTTQKPEKPGRPERPERPDDPDKIIVVQNDTIRCSEELDREMALEFLDARKTTVDFDDIVVMVSVDGKTTKLINGLKLNLTPHDGKEITVDYKFDGKVFATLEVSVECEKIVFMNKVVTNNYKMTEYKTVESFKFDPMSYVDEDETIGTVKATVVDDTGAEVTDIDLKDIDAGVYTITYTLDGTTITQDVELTIK